MQTAGICAAPAAFEQELHAYMKKSRNSPTWDPRFAPAANRFITRGKAAGWWEHMAAVYFFCAPDREAALYNARGDTLNLTAQGHVDFTTLAGMQGDGSTGYLETGVKAANIPGWTSDAHSLFVFSQSDRPSIAGEAGAIGAGANIGIRIRHGALLGIWSNNKVLLSHPCNSGRGLTGFVRNGSAGGFIVKNDVQIDFEQKPEAVPNGTLRFFRIGSTRYFSANKLAFGFLGDGKITKAQTRDIFEACLEMLGADGLGTLEEDEELLPTTPPHAFARESINQVTPKGVRIFRFTQPPASDSMDFAAGYPHGPLSDCITRPWGQSAASTDSQVRRWELIVSDRALGPARGIVTSKSRKANDTMGQIRNPSGAYCRTEFNSFEKAAGSTLVKTAYSAGLKFRSDSDHPDGKGWGDIAEEWGYDVSAWQARWIANRNDPIFTTDMNADTGDIVHRKFCVAPENIDAFFSNNSADGASRTSRDRVILGQGRMADIRMGCGFLLDLEHADGRPPELQMRFVAEMRKIARCKDLRLAAYGYIPYSSAGLQCGWRLENANRMLNMLDWYGLVAESSHTGEKLKMHLETQYAFFKGPGCKFDVPGEKLCMQIEIGAQGHEILLSDIRIIREFMLSKGIRQCLVMPAGTKPGGSIQRMSNQALATLLGLPIQ